MTSPNWFGYTDTPERALERIDSREWKHAIGDYKVSEEDADFLHLLVTHANTDPAHVRYNSEAEAEAQTLESWNKLAAKHAPKPRVLKAFIDCTHPNEYPTMNGMHCKDCGTTRDPIGQFETSLVSKLSPRDSGYVKF